MRAALAASLLLLCSLLFVGGVLVRGATPLALGSLAGVPLTFDIATAAALLAKAEAALPPPVQRYVPFVKSLPWVHIVCTTVGIHLISLVFLFWKLTRRVPAAVSPTSFPQTTSKKCLSRETDIVCIGAGIAGSSLAATLALRGHRVICVEQQIEERKSIIGELLQPGGVQSLTRLGLASTLEGFDAQTIPGYTIYNHGEIVDIEYPKDTAGNIFLGKAFHNGRWLQQMRKFMVKAGGKLVEGTATELLKEDSGRVSGVKYRTKDGEIHIISAALTVVCDGLFSSFRSETMQNTFQQRGKFLGLLIENPSWPSAQAGANVFLGNESPILMYPISSTEARMLIDFPSYKLDIPNDKDALANYLMNNTYHQLPDCVKPSFKAAVDSRFSMQMPNRQMCGAHKPLPGSLTLGDSYNIRHPITGGGMTVALSDVESIVQSIRYISDFNDFASIDSAVSQHYERRGDCSGTINILADALYDVFNNHYPLLKNACTSYLNQGGEMSAGPVRLLSGISRSEMLLVFHFFAVALWGCGRQFLPFPSPLSPFRAWKILRDANIIILPLLLVEHRTLWAAFLATIIRILFFIPPKSYFFKQQK